MKPGTKVEFRRKPGGFTRWERGVVVEVDGNTQRVTVDAGKRGRFVVMPRHVRELASANASRARRIRRMMAEPTPGEPITCTTKRGPSLGPIPKPKTYRSEAFLRFVREHPCIFDGGCAGPVEAHHHGKHAMGMKTDDCRCVPLCVAHHAEITDHGYVARAEELVELIYHPENRESFMRMASELAVLRSSVELQTEWIRRSRR